MAYRKTQRYFSFADLAVEKHTDKNRALAVLKQLNLTIDCNQPNQKTPGPILPNRQTT